GVVRVVCLGRFGASRRRVNRRFPHALRVEGVGQSQRVVLAGRRRRGGDVVGRHVYHLRRVADCPRADEELFISTINTVRHRADADTVGVDFGADAARAVVDGEIIPPGYDCLKQGVTRIIERLESLSRRREHLVVDDRDLSVRLFPVGGGRVLTEQWIDFDTWLARLVARRFRLTDARGAGKAARLRAGEYGCQVAVVELELCAALFRPARPVGLRLLLGGGHLQDRGAGAGRVLVVRRVAGVILDDGLP